MKLRALFLLSAGAGLSTMISTTSVDANLPASAITELSMPLYGMYTTSDPLCQEGLVATLPLSASPERTNLADSPTLGTGDLPADGIACVIMIVQDNFMLGWSPGDYTGQSKFGTSTYEDSNCNEGGTEGPMPLCRKNSNAPTWPQQILDDMAALGITPADDCSGDGDLTRALPLYLSTASKCVGEVTADAEIGGDCDWQLNTDVTPEGYRSNTMWQLPTATNDARHGVHMDAVPQGTTNFKFIADPTPTIGGNGSDPGECGGLNPPRLAFEALETR